MKHAFYSIVFVAICTVLGCGEKVIKTEYVEGTVRHKGEPVADAVLVFSPVNESEGSLSAHGRTNTEGKYVIQTRGGAIGKGTTPGEYKVLVSKSTVTVVGKIKTVPGGPEYDDIRHEEALPKVYNAITTTPLTVTVKAGGPNVFDFDLVDNPGR